MIILDNGTLRVSILEPCKVYGTRFAHSGFIASVVYKGKEYMGKEAQDTMGEGLCNEFSIHTPIDYDITPKGEYFSKIGVGQLLRDDDEYRFIKRYECRPDEIDIIPGENCVEFIHKPAKLRDMAYSYSTKIAIDENKIHISYHLSNDGDMPIHTDEYRHNFLNMGGGDVDENYAIELTGKPEFTCHDGNAVIENGTLRLTRKNNGPFHVGVSALPESVEQFASAVSNHREGMYVIERCFFTPSFVHVWGRGDVISVEIFKKIDLLPGEEDSWEREYVFQ